MQRKRTQSGWHRQTHNLTHTKEKKTKQNKTKQKKHEQITKSNGIRIEINIYIKFKNL